MSRERDFIAKLAAIATHPAARGLRDDAAVLDVPAGAIVLTHDMLVEGVHFLATDPPEDIGWKLAAVNLSDLAAKGAEPLGALLGYALSADPAWDDRFVDGLAQALGQFGVPLLGGDTISLPPGAPRQLGMTLLGRAPPGGAPARSGARAGDVLYVTGTIGLAGLGLDLARSGRDGAALAAYRRPIPRLRAGQALAPCVHAMSDVSDGLLIDAARMAAASGLAVEITLDTVPFAPGIAGDHAACIAAATAGDDYELLCAGPAGLRLPARTDVPLTAIGRFGIGQGLRLTDGGVALPLPDRLGYEHGS